ncbi:uncharacterized protein LOC129773291 [Toxorhynchites rutilus septentrionalis]|uniref:uncharacterized protein LOC129773291 n=1 Tax=Toxorhynchites rutilus septentrionalis TaxID=329112 RepID=UPI00247963E4|nr:uncharacterized protein LOC129773291 [Toxorhynchites rutilus septentrionalis]
MADPPLLSTPRNTERDADSSNLEIGIGRIESKLDKLIGWQQEVISEVRNIQVALNELRTTTETLMDEQQQLREQNDELRKKVEWCEIEIDKQKQEKLSHSLEMSNIPDMEGEDLFKIANTICGEIGVELRKDEVKEIFRTPAYASTKSQLPPSIQNLQLPSQSNTRSLTTIKSLKINKTNSLKLFYFNARSLRDKLTELEVLLDDAPCRMDVLLITETWSRGDVESSMSLLNYNCFFASRSSRRGGGSAIFVHKDINAKLVESYCDEYNSIVAVEIGYPQKIVLTCVYRPPQTLATAVDGFIELLDEFLTRRGKYTMILCGDFNIDLLRTNTTVQKYTTTVHSNGFNFCDTTPTRYEACLDHISTNNTAIHTTVQHLQYSLFDHDAIFVEADYKITSLPQMREVYPKININSFREILLQHPIVTSRSVGVETNYTSFISRFQQAQGNSSKRILVSTVTRRHSKPWMDYEVVVCIRAKNYWYAKHRKNRSDNFVRNVYYDWCRKVTYMKRRKMKQYYANKFERAKGSVSKTWDTIKQVIGTIKNCDAITGKCDTLEDRLCVLENANNYFARAGAQLAKKIPYVDLGPFCEQTNISLNFTTVGLSNVKEFINALPATASAGYDGIQSTILKELCEELSPNICDIVNSSILQARIPAELKVAKVVAIPKSSTPSNISEFRPISIPCVVDKILQKAINKQLMEHLENHSLLSSRQYGFRPSSNTQAALFDVVSTIQSLCDRKEKVAAVFLDLSKAFDTCNRKILLRRLNELGVKGKSCKWFRDFLDNRKQYLYDKGISSSQHPIDFGVVQGSTLGPTLFNCYINNLKDLPLHGILFMYADDIVLIYTGANCNELQQLIN